MGRRRRHGAESKTRERTGYVVRLYTSRGIHRLKLASASICDLEVLVQRKTGIAPDDQDLCLDEAGREPLRSRQLRTPGVQVFLVNKVVESERWPDFDFDRDDGDFDEARLTSSTLLERVGSRSELLARRDNELAKCVTYAGALQPQSYCHFAGTVVVEQGTLGRFLAPWRASGCNIVTCGILFGTRDVSGTAGSGSSGKGRVRATQVFEDVAVEDARVMRACRVARLAGLEPIGCVCTWPRRAGLEEGVIRSVARLQLLFRDDVVDFPTVLCLPGSHAGEPERLWAYMASDRAVAFVRDAKRDDGDTPLAWDKCMVGIGPVKTEARNCSAAPALTLPSSPDELFPISGRGSTAGSAAVHYDDVNQGTVADWLHAHPLRQLKEDMHFLWALGEWFGVQAAKAALRAPTRRQERELVRSMLASASSSARPSLG